MLSGSGGGGSSEGTSSSVRRSAETEVRKRRTSEERDREFEELRRKLQDRRNSRQSKPAVSNMEKLVLFFLVLVCLYVGSPFFRESVKRTVTSIVWGKPMDGEEDDFFDY